MQARVDWVLILFGTQITVQKRPVRPVFLSISYDYGENKSAAIKKRSILHTVATILDIIDV